MSNQRNHRRKNNKQTCYLHELVAQAHVPNPDHCHYIEHIDGNKLNNCASNLRWTNNRPEGYPSDRP